MRSRGWSNSQRQKIGVAKGWGRVDGELVLNGGGAKFQLGKMEKVLELDGGDGGTRM